MQIKILKSAEQDISSSAIFYDKQLSGLGSYFLKTVIADIDKLSETAGIHPKFNGFHRLLTRKFPYAVYYKIFDKCACIYAVLDCRSDPAKRP